MARIRTIKPGFFKHDVLFDAEKESGLPLRVAFAGLWTVADREGRFKWQPRVIKVDVLPYDEVDFAAVLEALRSVGLVRRYTIGGKEYGFIPTFKEHQHVNKNEAPSAIPGPDGSTTVNSPHDDGERTIKEPSLHHEEGKGKEQEGKEEDLSEPAAPVADQTLPSKPKAVKQPQAPKGEKRNAYPADFEEFWAGYPTDKNMGKAETLVPWLKLDAEERKQAIAALPGFREYCRQNQGWYRPSHAVKFLKARRFEQYAAASAEAEASAEQHDASLQATITAWNGSAEKLCGRIGDKAFGQWFTGSKIEVGPPPRIVVAKQFQRDQILSKYGPMLAETFGNDVQVEVAA